VSQTQAIVPTDQPVFTDSMGDPTAGLFPPAQYGSDSLGFSNGTSADFTWDYKYEYSALVGHVVGPYPNNPDASWLEASTSLDRPLPHDFAVQVHARSSRSIEASAFGLAYGPAPDQRYEFDLTPVDQSFRLVLGDSQPPAASGRSNWIQAGTVINVLRLEVQGETLRVLANGHELARAAPPGLAARNGGAISLRWAMTGPPSEGNSVESRFAQFAVYALP
jgi:hypothetical protein